MGEYTQNLTIKAWAEDDRPREKMLKLGRQALSDAELIAILIRAGTQKQSAVELARIILGNVKNNLNELAKLSVKDLMKEKGMGEAKALSIIAALELGRRRKSSEQPEKDKISSSRDAFELSKQYFLDLHHEEFWIFLVDRGGNVKSRHNVSKGGVGGTVVDVKIIFKLAIENLASGIVLCHNHPSGSLYPSDNDLKLTRSLAETGKIMEIPILDHIIVTDTSYYSFADEGQL